MSRSTRLLITAMVLVTWVLSGPLLTMMCHCVGMGIVCEQVCAPSCSPVVAPASIAAPQIAPLLSAERPTSFPMPTMQVPKPPPRPLSFLPLSSVTL
jgi:hypothetical protein